MNDLMSDFEDPHNPARPNHVDVYNTQFYADCIRKGDAPEVVLSVARAEWRNEDIRNRQALEMIREASAELAWRDNAALVTRIDEILLDRLGALNIPVPGAGNK